MTTTQQWVKEFDRSYDVPTEILMFVSEGILMDFSYHNDSCPCFIFEEDLNYNNPIKIWVHHAIPSQRDNGARFIVTNHDGDDILETNSLLEIVEWIKDNQPSHFCSDSCRFNGCSKH